MSVVIRNILFYLNILENTDIALARQITSYTLPDKFDSLNTKESYGSFWSQWIKNTSIYIGLIMQNSAGTLVNDQFHSLDGIPSHCIVDYHDGKWYNQKEPVQIIHRKWHCNGKVIKDSTQDPWCTYST